MSTHAPESRRQTNEEETTRATLEVLTDHLQR
jgi:hypothetical protein